MIISPILKKRFSKFRANRRAWYSLNVLLITYSVSLFAPLIATNQPLIVSYEGRWSFPVFKFYPESHFGGENLTPQNYKRLAKREDFTSGKNWILFAPVPYGFNEDNLESLDEGETPPSPPNAKHWLGTDDRGRDVFTRIFYGYRNALTFGLILVFLELAMGTFIGGMQGYYGGKFDILMQRLIEILSAIPFLYLILIVGAFFGRGFTVLLITYGALSWIGISYYMRGEFYKLKQLTYVDAAKALGVDPFRIMMRHILPNAIMPLVTFLPFTLIGSISILSALDFLGYGIPAPNPSWGEMIGQGRERLGSWWLITFPSAALFSTILLTSFIGEGLRDSFDSREKAVYE
ncbi:ABC transporter permease subunit [Leptospira ellisii]|uniref:ABC transporter permease n=1 Tax=Leptospira ellisii TaxID=2023197 RepID=A0A2N0BBX4_9LEPT|nr:ABC transporter permease subunit [Leptospira ellisii]MDV6237441.1 ABC transporter permease subunit [Leptospira ellisii]PJZ93991.1 ABC transporter permease [Leptospira ellisii]PKA05431.1 ABC transporter permease [Leptospira ellisii]